MNLTGNGGALNYTDPQMRFDAAGNATAAWSFDDRSTSQMVQTAGLGGGPPRLTAVSFPAGGQAGSPLPFSASPCRAPPCAGFRQGPHVMRVI